MWKTTLRSPSRGKRASCVWEKSTPTSSPARTNAVTVSGTDFPLIPTPIRRPSLNLFTPSLDPQRDGGDVVVRLGIPRKAGDFGANLIEGRGRGAAGGQAAEGGRDALAAEEVAQGTGRLDQA